MLILDFNMVDYFFLFTQLSEEINRWPYDFPKSEDFVPTNKRGRVEGQLLVQDRYMFMKLYFIYNLFSYQRLMLLAYTTRHIKGGQFVYANNAYIGLALPGDVGSWQRQSKVFLVSIMFQSLLHH